MCELCELHFLTPQPVPSRRIAIRAELDRSYRRLGAILYERGLGTPRGEDDPIVPPAVAPIALLLAAKIRDLTADLRGSRPQ